jgi:hypothetical protein
VQLAINLADDTDLVPGKPGIHGKMRVVAADQNYKVQKDKPAASEEAKKKGTAANRDRQKVIKKAEEMNRYARHLSLLSHQSTPLTPEPQPPSRLGRRRRLHHPLRHQP